jgi:hypothetical protein
LRISSSPTAISAWESIARVFEEEAGVGPLPPTSARSFVARIVQPKADRPAPD